MQPVPAPHTSTHRRQQYSDEQPSSQHISSMASTSSSGAAPRTTSGSSRSQSSRSVNQPDKQLSQIEKSVTHLLVATKQLLETLTQWSRSQAQEEEVSDVYVRLGYEFNLTCRAFNSIGVETADLGPVPDLLRAILEDTLSQSASRQSLDNFLPRIQDIIINLLHGLKLKQAKLRSRSGKERTDKGQTPARQASGGSLAGNQTGLTSMLEDMSPQAYHRPGESTLESSNAYEGRGGTPPQATSNTSAGTSAPSRHSLLRNINRCAPSSSGPSYSASTSQKSSPRTSHPGGGQTPAELGAGSTSSPKLPQPPRPPPKPMDALAALQRGGDLERRASRRFSNYQISKHLGPSPTSIPLIPPPHNSPAPNRGRDDRESMSAVQSRKSIHHPRHQRYGSRHGESSPVRNGMVKAPEPITEESPESARQSLSLVPPTYAGGQDSPTLKTPDEMYGQKDELSLRDRPLISATLNDPGPSFPARSPISPLGEANKPVPPQHQHTPIRQQTVSSSISGVKDKVETPPTSQHFIPDDSPPPGKELTLFLQYKSKIKKFVLPEGSDELSIARLQLAFIEKFAWNTHNHGVDLPDIYVQDPVSGVRHELEDLSDVRDRSVLVLNVEVLDEVKRHFDDGIGGIRNILDGVRGTLEGQESSIERFSERLLETSKEMTKIAAAPHPAVPALVRARSGPSTPATSTAGLAEVQSLRRDIAILRQSYGTLSADLSGSMNAIRQKGTNVKSIAAKTVLPAVEGGADRAHAIHNKKSLIQDSGALVIRVDDMSDLVEDLRKDVVTRGVRTRPRQLEDASKDISTAVKEHMRLKEVLKREKPIWTKIWEKDLDLVCQERDELTQQEELMADLNGDIDDAVAVFKLVEEATKQQNLQQGTPGGLRSTSRSLPIDPGIDPQTAKDGVLGEVRALRPNHENRLEAIERAERTRQRELAARRGGEFQREVENFVEEGKLKKTGGAEEVERLRRAKDEKARKESWNRAQQRQAEAEAQEVEQGGVTGTSGEADDGPPAAEVVAQASTAADGATDGAAQTRLSPELSTRGDEEPMAQSDTADSSNQGHQQEQEQDKNGSPVTPKSSSKTTWFPAIFSG